MTSLIGLSAVFNVLVLVVLAAAVARPRLSPLARLMIATFAFAWTWLVNAAFDATQPPAWTIVMGGAVIVVSVVVVLATLHLWTQAGDDGETKPEHRDDEGDGGPRRHRPDAPEPPGGGSDPSWWPEFERRLASYAAERERNRHPAGLPD
jgi:hypothetical protein